jgi:hypothetical protein
MKTLLISSGAPIPGALKEVIQRGSTSLDERAPRDLDPAAPLPDAVDRVVFWAPEPDDTLRRIASRFARDERTSRRDVIVYVTSPGQQPAEGVAANEAYEWPRDEDKLVMAFMTSA